MAARYIENNMRDFAVRPAPKKGKARKVSAEEDAVMHSALRLSLQRIVREAPPAEAAKSRDFSVYTGTAGYSLLFLVLHSRGIGFGNSGRTGQLAGYSNPLEVASLYLEAAQASLVRQEVRRPGKQGITFLTGAAGVHAVGAAVAQRAGDEVACRHHARRVAVMESEALAEHDNRSHELLYGLAGYLSALLFVRANTRGDIGEEEVPDPLLLRIVDRIVSDGAGAPDVRWGSVPSPVGNDGTRGSEDESDDMEELDTGRRDKANGRRSNGSARSSASRNGSSTRRDSGAEMDGEFGSVLTYEWHAKMYLGAAHGVAGILYVLMQALQTVYGASLLMETRADVSGRADLPPQAAEQLYLIRSTVDAVLGTELPGSNYPSRPGNADDRLVQWCHGAPGVIPMLTKAYEVFEDERYLEAARRSSEVVWKRGLLTKGNGICHGVAGNAYAFLALRKADGSDGRHLHRARSFAGFTAAAILGPNPSAGANAFRGDPFGPGAHAHPKGYSGAGNLGRSSSSDSGKALPAFGWPGYGGGGLSKGSGCGVASNGGGCGAVVAGGVGVVGGGDGGGTRSSRARSRSVSMSHHELQAQPDRPMSMFEGLSGAAAFLADMVSESRAVEHAWFPSLELP